MKKWIILTALASAFALSTMAFAAPGDRPGRDGPPQGIRDRQGPQGPQQRPHQGMMLERILNNPAAAERLDLSDEQIASLKELQLATAKEVIPLRGQVELAQLELRDAMGPDSPDVDAAMAAIDKLHRAQAAVQKAQVRSRFAARDIIGTEKLAEMKEGIRERMQRRPDRDQPRRRPQRPAPDSE